MVFCPPLNRHKPALVAALASTLLGIAKPAWGVAVANTLNEIVLADATAALIDPVSGVSPGTPGSDLRIAVGDIALFRFAFTPLPDSRQRALQAYLTVYVPSGAEFIGARILDEAGNSIVPNLPGLAIDGCSGGADCNDFDNLPCNDGLDNCNFAGGAISQVHGDTGIFFSNDVRLTRDPDNTFLVPANGIQMSPQPAGIEPDLTDLLGYSAPFFVHNAWDWAQVRGFGASTDAAGTGGGGNTPYLYGSPVAGPHTFYSFEATDTGAFGIQFNDVTGPWQRSGYPGSVIGFGNCLSNVSAGIVCAPEATGIARRTSIQTGAGLDVKPANAVNVRAVRFAMGEARVGGPMLAEIALRATAVPIDPEFGKNGDNVLCAEVFGGAISLRGTGQDGAHHPWRTYINAPMCMYLQRQVTIEANRLLFGGDPMEFNLRFRNLSLVQEQGVVMRQIYDAALMSFTGAVPAPDSGPGLCPAPYDTSKTCLGWNLGNVDPAQEAMVDSSFDALVAEGISITELAVESAALPAPGAQSSAVSIITPIAKPTASLAPSFDPTAMFAAAGAPVMLTGMIGNGGTADFNWDSLVLVLPAGWSVTGNEITVGGVTFPCTAGCGTSTQEFSIATVSPADSQAELSFSVDVPMGTGAGLYTMDLQAWGTQTGFGGDFETLFPGIATLNVAAVRSEKPVIGCPPILSTDTQISGTAEADSDISLQFNLSERGTCQADVMGEWACVFADFGTLYGGLEIRATAQAPMELESELSDACTVAPHVLPSDSFYLDGFELLP